MMWWAGDVRGNFPICRNNTKTCTEGWLVTLTSGDTGINTSEMTRHWDRTGRRFLWNDIVRIIVRGRHCRGHRWNNKLDPSFIQPCSTLSRTLQPPSTAAPSQSVKTPHGQRTMVPKSAAPSLGGMFIGFHKLKSNSPVELSWLLSKTCDKDNIHILLLHSGGYVSSLSEIIVTGTRPSRLKSVVRGGALLSTTSRHFSANSFHIKKEQVLANSINLSLVLTNKQSVFIGLSLEIIFHVPRLSLSYLVIDSLLWFPCSRVFPRCDPSDAMCNSAICQ